MAKKILIIEDEEALANVLEAKLKKEGHDVEVGYNGETGYDLIKSWQPDLILLDIVMPKMNGYEVLEKIFTSVPETNEVITLIGDEIPVENLGKCSVTFTRYQLGNKSGYIGVIGPARANYSKVIPIIKYTKKLLEELGGNY